MEALSAAASLIGLLESSRQAMMPNRRALPGRNHFTKHFPKYIALVEELAHSLDNLQEITVATGSEFATIKIEASEMAEELLIFHYYLKQLKEVQHLTFWATPSIFIRCFATKSYLIPIRGIFHRLKALQDRIQIAILTRLNGVRDADIQLIKESQEFQELDAYSNAAATALLDQFLASENDQDAARYFLSAGQLINQVRASGGARDVHDVDSPSNQARAAEHQKMVSADGALMELLQYRVMENRKEMITKAYESSCQWVYREPVNENWKSLPDWLARGSSVYLIVGNEASGKSTMMKYIFAHEETLENLRRWAHPSPLVTAAFFFWRNGTRLEKSEEGLWRSLLYSCLDQQPQLIPVVFPKEWAMLYSSSSSEDSLLNPGLGAWEVEELRQAFRQLVTQDQMSLKLFILIDGIDEYHNDESGDRFTDIVRFIKNVASSPNAKALISSRPLEAFDRTGLEPSLTLHELNHDDIESYVRDVLDEDDLFRAGRATDNEKAESVIRYILSASKGVFLWAVLSVRTVKSKLAGGETLQEITLDLEGELAPALRDLYRVIWDGMEAAAKTQASQILQIMLAGKEIKRSWLDNDEESLRLIDLALGLGDPDETIKAHVVPWHLAQSDVQNKCNSIATGFMKTWPGFITTANLRESERKWNPSSRIRYCHRSVPEFFSENYTSLLRDATRELSFQFCPRVAHLKTVVHQLKVLPKPLLNEPLRVLWAFVTTALLAANLIDTGDSFKPGNQDDSGSSGSVARNPSDSGESYALDTRKYHDLLAELDRTMEHHHKSLQQDIDGNYLPTVLRDHRGTVAFDDGGRDSRLKAAMHWSNFHSDPEYAHPRSWNDSFLSLAVQFGLRNYVESQLGSGSSSKVLKSKKGRPLLDYALRPSLPPAVVPYSLVTPAVIETLLTHGAHPNDKFEGRTCWEGALLWQFNVFVEAEGRAISETGGTTEDARRVADARAEMFGMLLDAGADVLASIVTARGTKISARRGLDASLKGWAKAEVLQALLGRLPEEKTNRTMSFRAFRN